MRNTRSVFVSSWYYQPVWWAVGVLLLASCSLDSGQKAVVSLPTGHYEGPISYQGTELLAVLDLRESKPGQLEADLHFPELEGLDFAAANLSYSEPQLRFEEPAQPGGIQITAIREGDFLRGVFTLDSVRADFVWVRRGQPEPRSYQEKQLQLPAAQGTTPFTVLVPNDTATQHAAIALFADSAHQAAATARANQLSRQGFITTVVAVRPATELPDSAMLRTAAAVLLALRRVPTTDTTKIGLWANGEAAVVIPAATMVKPQAAFVVLENVPVTSVEQTKPFQSLTRQRVPVLGLYAAADTSLNVKESTRRLRSALGFRRNTLIQTFPKADANFRVPGGLTEDGKWSWPRPASGYVKAVQEWRK